MMVERILFWVSFFLLVYLYFGYPALIRLWAAVRSRPVHRAQFEPTVTLLVIAHNEGSRIRARIENLLSLDYPRDRLGIWIASDGSADSTAARARAYGPAGVRAIAFDAHRGKPAVLNDLVPKAHGEIVVLADARQRFEADALRALVAPFGDPRVGAVSGELILSENTEGTAVGEGTGFYWRYEKFIRWSESRVDSTIGTTGAIYAIRRSLFEPIPDDTLLDDVLIPVRIVRQGYRVLFEPGARAFDRAAATSKEEFTRKVRTIAGNFQLFVRERWLLNPFRNRLWFQTVSHKGLRLLAPLLLVTAFGTNLLLIGQPLYRFLMAGQALFYLSALSGLAFRHEKRKIPVLSVPYVFCLLGWATVVAFLRFVAGRQSVRWGTESASRPRHLGPDSIRLPAKTSRMRSSG
jgi:cellulose synthase/poly-beta-1,6-N-acetylglucosamine synthase-like glycosyltransferase